MKNEVIVFGGVHIDILADYDKKDKSRIDRVGELHYSIGGTAFNIAHHISEKKYKVGLFSILNKNSYSTLWIFRELRHSKIIPYFQVDSSTYTENGFIAIRQNGVLESAVTSSYLSKAELKTKLLEKYSKSKKIAVIDCNFESHQIAKIVSHCKKNNLKVIIAATSDSKVKRIKPVLNNYTIDIITMNEMEACVFFNIKSMKELTTEMVPKNILNLVITLGAKGHLVLCENQIQIYEAPHIAEIISPTGAGDALTAAITVSVLENNEIIWDDCNKKICEYVGEAMTQHGSYLKPTRKKIPFKIMALWGGTLLAAIAATIYCLIFDPTNIALYLTIIGLIVAFGQVVRTEIRE